MTNQEYLDNKGVRCLVCGSTQIEGCEIVVEAGYAYQTISCLDCKASWEDEYKLHSVELLEG